MKSEVEKPRKRHASSDVVSASQVTSREERPAKQGRRNGKEKRVDDESKAEDAVLPMASASFIHSATIPAEWTAPPTGPVRLSLTDRSPPLAVTNPEGQPSMARGSRGFRSVRATHGVCEGSWYFEVEIVSYEGGGAVRVGWSTRRSDAETPVGADGQGFGLRDRTGEFVHMAKLRSYGERFGVGDTIGCLIRLPSMESRVKDLIASSDMRWLEFRFINFLQGRPPPDTGVELDGASVEFFKNGKSMGIAMPSSSTQCHDTSAGTGVEQRGVRDSLGKDPHAVKLSGEKCSSGIPAGIYYPTVSLFRDAIVSVNFGPQLRYLPSECDVRPMSQCYRPEPTPTEPAKKDTVDEKEPVETDDKS